MNLRIILRFFPRELFFWVIALFFKNFSLGSRPYEKIDFLIPLQLKLKSLQNNFHGNCTKI